MGKCLKCDQCGFVGTGYCDHDQKAWDGLKRWIHLSIWGTLGEPPTLCGLECLKAWTQKRIDAGGR